MSDWAMIIIRTLTAVITLFFMTKLLGKRQVSELSLFEYITGITIGNLAGYISLDLDTNWYLGILSLFVWVLVSFGIEFLQIKSKRMRDLIDGRATVLIKDGKILEKNLKKEKLTTDELLEQLRSKDAFSFADVEFAIMETNGQINVLLKRENQTLTPKHLGITVAPEKAPSAVIMDGKVMDEALVTMGYNRGWLNEKLDGPGLLVENVFLGQVDSYGQLYVDLADDKLTVPEPQMKASLYASLKKCEADLEMFALSTEDEKAKRMYANNAERMQDVLMNIKPILHT
ncbi:MAG: DUF421 domain-containing protein [Gorillibacterium sp.]|nr:DUF421 domain-containing protein [Gorillibacterium sp.]